MLLRGLYTFDPRPEDHSHTLPFSCNDNLIFLGTLKRDSNWIKVADIRGRIGYVPIDFVQPAENYGNFDYVVSFLVDAIVKARQAGLQSAANLETLKNEISNYPSKLDRRAYEMMKAFGYIQEQKNTVKKSEHVVTKSLQRTKNSSTQIPVESVETILDKLTISHSPTSRLSRSSPRKELERSMKGLSNLSKINFKETRRKTCDRNLGENLDELRKLLIQCDPLHATALLETNRHEFSQDLVHLYHLESPLDVKERMLDIFLIICTLDKQGRAVLLSTTLPLNLTRELIAERVKEGKFFAQHVDLLTSLLACGEAMPDTHYEIIGTGFVNLLIKEIEDWFSKSFQYDREHPSDKISTFMNLILAYNLQFQESKENLVLKVLVDRPRPKGFMSILIELFKKGVDPFQLDLEDDFKSLPNSVFKMMHDICLCQRTVAHFTQTDMKIVVDGIVEGLIENKAGDIRIGYLQVLWTLLSTFPYSLVDVRAALLNILLDSDPLAFQEQKMIRAMSREFPALFTSSISRAKTNVDMQQQDELSYLSS